MCGKSRGGEGCPVMVPSRCVQGPVDNHQTRFHSPLIQTILSLLFQNWLDPAKEIKKQIRSKFPRMFGCGAMTVFRGGVV